MTLLQTKDNHVSIHTDAFPEFPFVTRSMIGTPPVDIYEEDGKYVVELAVPGYASDEIDVEIKGNVLTISGEQEEDEEDEETDVRYHRREIRRSFTRTILLPQDVNSEDATAEIECGILTIELAPLKPNSAKKIEVVEA